MIKQWELWLIAATSLAFAGCIEEPRPRAVTEFLDDPIALEAALTRCNANRTRTRSDPECENARAAVSRIETAEEAKREVELEAQSERKREALRRRQMRAAEARRLAEEQARRREEALYLGEIVEQQGGPAGGAGDGTTAPYQPYSEGSYSEGSYSEGSYPEGEYSRGSPSEGAPPQDTAGYPGASPGGFVAQPDSYSNAPAAGIAAQPDGYPSAPGSGFSAPQQRPEATVPPRSATGAGMTAAPRREAGPPAPAPAAAVPGSDAGGAPGAATTPSAGGAGDGDSVPSPAKPSADPVTEPSSLEALREELRRRRAQEAEAASGSPDGG